MAMTKEEMQLPKEILQSIEYSRRLRNTPTPKNKIHQREGGKGKMFSYITRMEAMRWLDKNYPGWTMMVDPMSAHSDEYSFCIAVTVRVTDPYTGVVRTIQCYGENEITYTRQGHEYVPKTYYKNAETDALKRCVYTLGGFSDVYSEADLEEIEVENVSEEDLEWYMTKVLPVIIEKVRDKDNRFNKIFVHMIKFYQGGFKRDVLESKYFGQDKGEENV